MEFVLTFKSDTAGAEAEIQQFIGQMRQVEAETQRASRAQQMLARLRKELAAQAKKERQDAFQALPLEEKLNQLYARRKDLADRIAKTGQDELKNLALRVAAGRTEQQIRGLESERDTLSKKQSDAQALKQEAETRKQIEAQTQRQARAEQSLSNMRRQLAEAARRERDEAFKRLPIEEQINRLMARRAELARLIERAGDNERRRTALQVGQVGNEAQIRGLESQRDALSKKQSDAQALKQEAETRKQIEAQTQRQARAEQSLSNMRRQLAEAARRERDEAFKRLPIEEQINRLMARRAELARLIERAGDNERRRTALQVRQVGNDAQIRAAQAQQDAQLRDAQAKKDSMAGSFLGGLLGATSMRKALGVDSFKTLLTGAGIRTALSGGMAKMGGALGIAALGGVGIAEARRLLSESSRITNQAAALDIGVESLQEFEFAAGKSGASTNDVGEGVETTGVTQMKALRGNKTLLEAYKRFNISANELKNSKPEELFRKIAAEIEKAPPSAQQLGDLLKIMGERADNLLPAFRNGFSGAIEEARRAGAIIDSDVISQLEAVDSRFELIKKNLSAGFAISVSKAGQGITALASGSLQGLTRAFSFMGALSTGVGIEEASKVANERADNLFKEAPKPEKKTSKKSGFTGEVRTEEEKRKLDELRKDNLKTLNDLGFDSLKTEDKVNFILARRAELLRKIRTERDELKREQLIAEDLEMEKRLVALEDQSPAARQAVKEGLETERQELIRKLQTERNKQKKQELLTRIDENSNQLSGLERREEETTKSAPKVDDLARIGLILGSRKDPLAERRMRQIEKIESSMNEGFRRLEDSLRQKL